MPHPDKMEQALRKWLEQYERPLSEAMALEESHLTALAEETRAALAEPSPEPPAEGAVTWAQVHTALYAFRSAKPGTQADRAYIALRDLIQRFAGAPQK